MWAALSLLTWIALAASCLARPGTSPPRRRTPIPRCDFPRLLLLQIAAPRATENPAGIPQKVRLRQPTG